MVRLPWNGMTITATSASAEAARARLGRADALTGLWERPHQENVTGCYAFATCAFWLTSLTALVCSPPPGGLGRAAMTVRIIVCLAVASLLLISAPAAALTDVRPSASSRPLGGPDELAAPPTAQDKHPKLDSRLSRVARVLRERGGPAAAEEIRHAAIGRTNVLCGFVGVTTFGTSGASASLAPLSVVGDRLSNRLLSR